MFAQLIPTLRSNDYFGQYGKISKIVIVKRTSTNRKNPVIGLYVTYHRKEDAARCIGAVDGAPPPGGGGDVMRASYGTTKYCMTFLRGQTCSDHGCLNLHEWGDEKDCFTKEDLTTLYVLQWRFPLLPLNSSPESIPSKIPKIDHEWLRSRRQTRRKVRNYCYDSAIYSFCLPRTSSLRWLG